ncbi:MULTISPECIES: ATP-binding cassette domain-containing protein [Devosia]|jgi:thiamine transport system ATP-binding protein|uniref:ATP-binding cassette domain-containing protein n=1 Tax=Devosia litorisediminis TaxID=2829817 RepID=A0A942IC17_9HYPH|nr:MULTISPECIES: ATP-binding cassette domain-containing protein [Devosia]MBS3847269.1 ATP-binding cassette domain-containing protein [Devosia litorisediminis]MCZ4346641.1 ATP-binding cassette domain-containing protein [Devosia neptuniae]|tara:strand:+ start:3956 stop:4594 length:639 start_codon:yes stop_codon:yes gene_type:complete
MLRVDALAFAHPGQAVPYNFSFDAAPGEITAISGASGSGKSTLLDLLAGFLHPIAGRIDLDDADLRPLLPEERPVSLLLQSESLFEHLRTDKNVRLGLPASTTRADADKRVAQALDEVGLEGFEKQIASTLSGGQKQRVALARTLLRDRPVLLLDEPFSALDDDTRVTIRDLVRTLTLRHRWHTVLVSHHADDVEALASRRYQLIDGRLQPG